MNLRKLLWQLRHPFSSPPWMTEGDVERADRQWERLSSVNQNTGFPTGDTRTLMQARDHAQSAALGAAEDSLENQEGPAS